MYNDSQSFQLSPYLSPSQSPNWPCTLPRYSRPPPHIPLSPPLSPSHYLLWFALIMPRRHPVPSIVLRDSWKSKRGVWGLHKLIVWVCLGKSARRAGSGFVDGRGSRREDRRKRGKRVSHLRWVWGILIWRKGLSRKAWKGQESFWRVTIWEGKFDVLRVSNH